MWTPLVWPEATIPWTTTLSKREEVFRVVMHREIPRRPRPHTRAKQSLAVVSKLRIVSIALNTPIANFTSHL